MNPNQYQLSEYDKTRIRPLIQQIQDKNLEFRYLMTIAYWYANKDYAKCITDAHKTRKVLRDFFKSNIRCWFFVEKHTDPSQKNYGGFHLHALVEDPSDRWENLTERQKHWISTLNAPAPSKGTEALPEGSPNTQQKVALIQKVVQRLQKQTVAQGSKGVDVRGSTTWNPACPTAPSSLSSFYPLMRSLLHRAILISNSSLPINKMDSNISHDSRAEYLEDRLEHLEELLSQNPRNHLVNTFYTLIQEEKEQCLLKLKAIKAN